VISLLVLVTRKKHLKPELELPQREQRPLKERIKPAEQKKIPQVMVKNQQNK